MPKTINHLITRLLAWVFERLPSPDDLLARDNLRLREQVETLTRLLNDATAAESDNLRRLADHRKRERHLEEGTRTPRPDNESLRASLVSATEAAGRSAVALEKMNAQAFAWSDALRRAFCRGEGWTPDHGWPTGDHTEDTMADAIVAREAALADEVKRLEAWISSVTAFSSTTTATESRLTVPGALLVVSVTLLTALFRDVSLFW